MCTPPLFVILFFFPVFNYNALNKWERFFSLLEELCKKEKKRWFLKPIGVKYLRVQQQRVHKEQNCAIKPRSPHHVHLNFFWNRRFCSSNFRLRKKTKYKHMHRNVSRNPTTMDQKILAQLRRIISISNHLSTEEFVAYTPA